MRALLRRCACLLLAEAGNVAMIFALALPPLAVATVGGVQLSYVMAARSAAQDAADGAALAGAEQISLSPVGAAQRAQAWAQAQLSSRSGTSTFTVRAEATDVHTLKVAVDTYTPSFFGDLLPAGGFRSHAQATAQQQSQAPLCVLIDGGRGDQLALLQKAKLRGSCLVHANGDVQVDAAAAITASRVEAVGRASGPINPTADVGATSITDPFASLTIPAVTCTGAHPQTILNNQTVTLPAGVHDGSVSIGNNSTVTLAPGEHYFCGQLSLGNNGHFDGTDVVLVFEKDASINAGSAANSALAGRRSGALAGFVLVTTRDRSSQFIMPTDPFSQITGAIYVPTSELDLTGSHVSATASDWTVIAAKALKVSGQADLQINTNYAGSQVQVPIGVGDKAASTGPSRLIH